MECGEWVDPWNTWRLCSRRDEVNWAVLAQLTAEINSLQAEKQIDELREEIRRLEEQISSVPQTPAGAQTPDR